MSRKLDPGSRWWFERREFDSGRYLLSWMWAWLVLFTAATTGFPNDMEIQGPVFIQEPTDQVDFSNTTGTSLFCAVHGVPKPVVTWLLSTGVLVTNVPGLREIHSNGTLIFYPFRPEEYRQDIHATVYRCTATNAVGSIISRNVYVRAVVKQYYEVHVYDEFVIRGNTAVFKCNIPSFVRDYVTVMAWIRNNSNGAQETIRHGDRFSVHQSGELHIRNAQDEDGNRVSYMCKTQHRLTGETRTSLSGGRLLVTDTGSSVPPRITHSKNSVTALEGDSAELPCAAQGYPLPTYSWRRLEGSTTKHVIINAHVQLISGSLLIRNSKISDAGVYLCVVNNTVGEEKSEVELKIFAPVFVFIEPQKQIIDVGKPASFRCSYTGFPINEVQWTKDGRPLASSQRVRFLTRESVHIESVQRDDRGMYQCFVISGQRAVQASAELRLGDARPQLLQTFDTKVLQPGASLSLQCVTSGNPPPQVKWTVDGTEIRSSERHLLAQQVSDHGDVISYVNISAVRSEDGGEYQCTAVNRVGSRFHRQRIDIYGPPLVRPLQNVSAVSGSTLSIRCLVAGYPIRSVTWERDGSVLPKNHRQKVFTNGTLQVHEVQRTIDAGMYTCVATGDDPGRKSRGSVHVSVMNPPQISPFSFPRDIQEGMRASVTCSVFHGDLPISVSWLKDGMVVRHGIDVVIRAVDDLTSTLIVQSITPKDNGNYTCQARNTAATVNYTVQLLVLVPPMWTHEPKESSVVSGKSITIDCQADGFPQPSVTWRKAIGRLPGDYVPIDYSSGRNYMYPNGSLWLTSIQDQDEGFYLCQANNSVGAGLSKVIFLKVHAPPRFEEKFRNQTTKRNHEAVLKCECKGDKPISIEWKTNNQRIDQRRKNKYSIQEESTSDGIVSRLRVSKASRDDTIEFSCIASNEYGKDQTWIYLIVQEPPEAPRNVKVTEQSSRAFSLSWVPPFDGNSQVLRYVIQIKPSNAAQWLPERKNVSVAGSETIAKVFNLKPAVDYRVTVAAENTIGLGLNSDIIHVTMDKEAPDGPPLNVSVESLSPQNLKVHWKAPRLENWNGDLIAYQVGHRLYASDKPYTFSTVDAKPDRRGQHVVDGLVKFMKYGIVVQAINEIGPGPLSAEVIVSTLEDVPSQPPRAIKCVPTSPQNLHLSWNPPAPQSLNGILRGYRVVYVPAEKQGNMFKPNMDMRTTSSADIVLEDLQKFTNYSIHVQAFTGAGDGVKSLTIHCKTKEDVPGPPADIKVLPMSSDAIIVSWIPPSKPNGIVTKYTIYMRIIDDFSQSASSFTLPPNQFYYEARSLNENLQYEFWLKASTAVGEGEQTRIISNSPVSTVPARIASFPQIIFAKRKDDVRLPCRAVGIPTPDREWLHMGKSMTGSSRAQVLPNGSLLLVNYRNTDNGNYSCKVQNIYAKDEIMHSVQNQPNKGNEYPPLPPNVKIAAITSNSIDVSWKFEEFEDLPIAGIILFSKKDGGDWEETRLDSLKHSYLLSNLACGTRYHIYMVSLNRFGSSERSDLVTVATTGKAPLAPEKEVVLEVNATFVTLQLPLWGDGGCSIFHFSVEYKERNSLEWTTVANKLSPKQAVTVDDLLPRTYYTIRVNAINGAGTTAVEYDFVTLKTGMDFANDEIFRGPRSRPKFYFDLNVLVPVVSALVIVIMAVLLVACAVVRRRRYNGFFYTVRSVRKPDHGNPLAVKEPPQKLADPSMKNDICDYGHAGTPPPSKRNFDQNNCNANVNDRNNGVYDDVSPYATFQLPSGRYEDVGDVRFHTFGYEGQIAEHPPSPQFQYSKVRKKTSNPTSHQIVTRGIPMNVRHSASKEHLNPLRSATLETEICDTYSGREEPIIPSAPPAEYDSCQSDSDVPDIAPPINRRAVRALNYVPDILDHRQDSSPSNETSPETASGSLSGSKRRKNREHSARPCVISVRTCTISSTDRCSSPESGADEVSFTFHSSSKSSRFYDSGQEKSSRQNNETNPKSPKCLAAVEEELIAMLKRGAESSMNHKEEINSCTNANA